jgi:hypothetical protein
MKKIIIVIVILIGVAFLYPKTKNVGTFDESSYRGEPIPKCFGFSRSFVILDGTGFTCYGVFY